MTLLVAILAAAAVLLIALLLGPMGPEWLLVPIVAVGAAVYVYRRRSRQRATA